MTPTEQARAFTAMLCCGACLGVLYDLLAPLRRIRGMCTAMDVFFGVCCAAGMILTALRLRCDPFRLYMFAGILCGMILYGMTVGAGIRRISAMVRKKTAKNREKYKKRSESAGN